MQVQDIAQVVAAYRELLLYMTTRWQRPCYDSRKVANSSIA